MAPSILNFGNRGELPSLRPDPFIPGKYPGTIGQNTVGPRPVWTIRRREKSLFPAGNKTTIPRLSSP